MKIIQEKCGEIGNVLALLQFTAQHEPKNENK